MTAVGYLLRMTRFIHSLTLSNLGITSLHLGHMFLAASDSMVPHTLQVLANQITDCNAKFSTLWVLVI